MELIFRKAGKKDVDGIIKLCNECFDENTPLEYAKKMFNKTRKDPNNIYLVGILDNKIIAHAKISIIQTMYENMNTYSILNHVCVKPEYRRNGIATKLLNEITRLSLESNCKKMELWSMNFRIAAHTCYKKYGFVLEDAGFFSKQIRN